MIWEAAETYHETFISLGKRAETNWFSQFIFKLWIKKQQVQDLLSRDRLENTNYIGPSQQGKNCFLNQPVLYKPWVQATTIIEGLEHLEAEDEKHRCLKVLKEHLHHQLHMKRNKMKGIKIKDVFSNISRFSSFITFCALKFIQPLVLCCMKKQAWLDIGLK